ncbi:MAG: response regulator transcription factor [Ketobacter sp.]|nr:response regulator transcription factor [Ketobacter sp.]
MEPLSLREREVLRAAAQGLSNGDIAERLYISINTVKTHLKKIYGKIEVSNRTQALRKAHLLGILEEFD